jgi:4-hydroxy-tetrahydrodipicolinate reductase
VADMRLVVAGAAGRMGRALVQIIRETSGAILVGAIARPGSDAVGQDAGLMAGCGKMGVTVTADTLGALAGADGVLDFTTPESTIALATIAAQARIVHIVGSTGLQPDDFARLDAAARHAVVIQSGNMSLGVNLMAALVEKVARTLGPEFDIEIVETHHRAKVDAPSGTALLLGAAAARGRSIDLDANSVRSRDGRTGPRPEGAIGFASLRGGSVVGDHRIIFAGPGERLELAHIAEDRSIFARGAVKAALWGRGRKPGLYSMNDVLGLGSGGRV